MKRKSNLIKLGDAIDQIFKQEHLDEKMAQFTVKANWKKIAGEMIGLNTTEITFNKKTIFITLKSAALKHELSFRKEILLKNINDFVKFNLVEQIVIH
jgi:predicted nucleic acid-binding Zn ribbon protein